jgi:hypothetical protein
MGKKNRKLSYLHFLDKALRSRRQLRLLLIFDIARTGLSCKKEGGVVERQKKSMAFVQNTPKGLDRLISPTFCSASLSVSSSGSSPIFRLTEILGTDIAEEMFEIEPILIAKVGGRRTIGRASGRGGYHECRVRRLVLEVGAGTGGD